MSVFTRFSDHGLEESYMTSLYKKLNYTLHFYRGLIYTDKSTVQLIHRNLMSKYEDAACNFHACIGVEDCSVKT